MKHPDQDGTVSKAIRGHQIIRLKTGDNLGVKMLKKGGV